MDKATKNATITYKEIETQNGTERCIVQHFYKGNQLIATIDKYGRLIEYRPLTFEEYKTIIETV